MLNIGPAEMVVIGIIVLLAVGPEQLPSVIRKVGNVVSQIRTVTEGFKSDFMAGIEEIEKATDLDKLSEQIVDPFNPATFEAQSKITKKSSVPDSDGTDSDDTDGDSANSDNTDGDSTNGDETASDDADSDETNISDVEDVDVDVAELSDVEDDDEPSSGAPVEELNAEKASTKSKAEMKREQSAKIVESMHTAGAATDLEPSDFESSDVSVDVDSLASGEES